MKRGMSYVYVAGTLLLTVLGQLVMKWQVSRGGLPDPANRLAFVWHMLGNPWVLRPRGRLRRSPVLDARAEQAAD